MLFLKELFRKIFGTRQTHKERHRLLHNHLDELFADFIQNADGRTVDTIMDLIKWSHKQTIETDHDEFA